MEKDHMDYGHLFFDPSSANRANLLLLGNNNPIFPGQRTTMMSMEDRVTQKRPFFTSPDEMLYDEEYYYDEQLPEKKRRLSPQQVVLLEKSFEEQNKLEPERKNELAKKLGMQPRQVAVWFQNRRARSKTKQIERDYEVLKASYDQLVCDYDTVAKDHSMLKDELELLKEMFKAKEERNAVGPKTNLAQQIQQDGHLIAAQEQLFKVEDGQSSGSGGSSTTSAICNEENLKMVMDSTGDSYFGCPPTSPPYMEAAPAVQVEEGDISDDGRSHFNILNVAPVDHHHGQEEGQALGWWVWS